MILTLEQQVCSLEYAKKLKEFGVRQDSYFYWSNIIDYPSIVDKYFKPERSGDFLISAFTVAELGEMILLWWDSGKREKNDYICRVFEENKTSTLHSFENTEANCRAQILIHIIEKKLITIEEINKCQEK